MSEQTPTALRRAVTVWVSEEYEVSEARRAARALAEELGLSLVVTSNVLTSVTELANNLFFHTVAGGTITLTAVGRDGDVGLEVICEDDGPGIPDVTLAMQDGFSTNGTLGGGLPGVARLMDEFEIASTVGVGTRIVARKWQPCK
jgi:serine/threonine-protein kinase RsbT